MGYYLEALPTFIRALRNYQHKALDLPLIRSGTLVILIGLITLITLITYGPQ
jgi:hypothetical protein